MRKIRPGQIDLSDVDSEILSHSIFFLGCKDNGCSTTNIDNSDWEENGVFVAPSMDTPLSPVYHKLAYPVVNLDFRNWILPRVSSDVISGLVIEVTFGESNDYVFYPPATSKDEFLYYLTCDPARISLIDLIKPNAGGTFLLIFRPMGGHWVYSALKKIQNGQ